MRYTVETHFLTEFETEEQYSIDEVKQETSDKLLKYDSKDLENDSNTPKKKLKKKRQLGFEKLLKNDSKYIDSSSETPKITIKKERKNEAISDETWKNIKVFYQRVLSSGWVWHTKPKTVLLTTSNFSLFQLKQKIVFYKQCWPYMVSIQKKS